MGAREDAERFEPGSAEEWGDWLARHHAERTGVWLVSARKASGRQAFDYDTAVTEALRFGWIDSVQRSVDQARSELRFAPRKRSSGWSRSNKVRIERLEREGRLESAGLAAVAAAQENGMWTPLDEVEDLVIPEDLAAQFDRRPRAREQWDLFPPSVRRARPKPR